MEAFILFAFGIFGGVLGEAAGIMAFQRVTVKQRPEWLRSWFFWLFVVFRVLCGGILVLAYLRSGVSLNAFLAIHIGASSPLIIRTLINEVPPIRPGKSD
jgi:hypothetical protein